jgi:hypothetical protein
VAKGQGRYPRIVEKLTPEEIQVLANSPNTEQDTLESLGLQDYQIEQVTKFLKRWKLNWRIGKAKWKNDFNEKLSKSDDTGIQKMLAEHTLPEVEDSTNVFEIEVKAPKWFYEELKVDKVKSARRGV